MRNTPQTTVVKEELEKLGHATNRELWAAVQSRIPGITLPSIHRITQRLRQQEIIGCAPSLSGEGIIDANPHPHSHFMCRSCNKLRDINLSDSAIHQIQTQLDNAIMEESLFIAGTCHPCTVR